MDDNTSGLPRIIIADDHTLLIEALAVLLAPIGQVIRMVPDGQRLLREVEALQPDLVITDLTMPGMSGFEVLRALRKRRLRVPVLVLTMHTDIGTLRTAMAAGASGYLIKSAAFEELANAVTSVLNGDHYIPPALREEFGKAPKTALEQLSPRQRAVLDALANGQTAKQIAVQLNITERTVVFHKEQLRTRLGAQSVVEMVDLLRRAGTVTAPRDAGNATG